jgi:hypothetical protein
MGDLAMKRAPFDFFVGEYSYEWRVSADGNMHRAGRSDSFAPSLIAAMQTFASLGAASFLCQTSGVRQYSFEVAYLDISNSFRVSHGSNAALHRRLGDLNNIFPMHTSAGLNATPDQPIVQHKKIDSLVIIQRIPRRITYHYSTSRKDLDTCLIPQ